MASMINISSGYCIKAGYRTNPALTTSTENQSFWKGKNVRLSSGAQRPAYQWAAEIIREKNLKEVVDLGCGLADKTSEILGRVTSRLTGIDQPAMADACRERYPSLRFFGLDLNTFEGNIPDEQFDLVVCCDVIEHVLYPEKLVAFMSRLLRAGGFALISTPERDLLRGKAHAGPPPNKAHVREWNSREFVEFVEECGMAIEEVRILDSQDRSPIIRALFSVISLFDREYYLASNLCVLCRPTR